MTSSLQKLNAGSVTSVVPTRILVCDLWSNNQEHNNLCCGWHLILISWIFWKVPLDNLCPEWSICLFRYFSVYVLSSCILQWYLIVLCVGYHVWICWSPFFPFSFAGLFYTLNLLLILQILHHVFIVLTVILQYSFFFFFSKLSVCHEWEGQESAQRPAKHRLIFFVPHTAKRDLQSYGTPWQGPLLKAGSSLKT